MPEIGFKIPLTCQEQANCCNFHKKLAHDIPKEKKRKILYLISPRLFNFVLRNYFSAAAPDLRVFYGKSKSFQFNFIFPLICMCPSENFHISLTFLLSILPSKFILGNKRWTKLFKRRSFPSLQATMKEIWKFNM